MSKVVALPSALVGDIAQRLRGLADVIASGKRHPKTTFVALVVVEVDENRRGLHKWTNYAYGLATPLEISGAFSIAAQTLTPLGD